MSAVQQVISSESISRLVHNTLNNCVRRKQLIIMNKFICDPIRLTENIIFTINNVTTYMADSYITLKTFTHLHPIRQCRLHVDRDNIRHWLTFNKTVVSYHAFNKRTLNLTVQCTATLTRQRRLD